MSRSPAMYFHADAVESTATPLVGRRVAGQSFLRAYLDHNTGDRIEAVADDAQQAQAFAAAVRGLGDQRALSVGLLRGDMDWTQPGCIFFPTPGFGDAPWRRLGFGARSCSLVGVTHTVATRRTSVGLHRLLSEPVEEWDAVICTSRAVHSVVARQHELSAAYLTERFGARRVPRPQLPIIPLGLHSRDFARSDAARARTRAELAVAEDDVVVMTMGRMSLVEKANPVPLYQALEVVAQATGKRLHLWMVGWAATEAEEQLFQRGLTLCPSVNVRFVDGRDETVRRDIWSGADIFTLPVDNIQETFGLVPVEAMAAGLPVVMPDWNGFRDTVVSDQTGMLIPTVMSPPGTELGHRLGKRFADGTDLYAHHLSAVQQQTVIDAAAYRAALEALVRDAGLRQRMGAAGAARAAQVFDWRAVYPQYLELAIELEQRRTHGADETAARDGPPSPLEVDPFDLYRQYPTRALRPDTSVTHVRTLDAPALEALDAINGRALYGRKFSEDARVLAIAAAIEEAGRLPVVDLTRMADFTEAEVIAAVLFLAKYDHVALEIP